LQVENGHEAILGGVRGEWAPPQDPPPDIWIEDQFCLRDFKKLAAHLARSVTREPEPEMLLRDLMEKILTKPESGGSKNGNA
jgi:hypothetical protein